MHIAIKILFILVAIFLAFLGIEFIQSDILVIDSARFFIGIPMLVSSATLLGIAFEKL
jgi:hypothetical protein